MIRYAVELTDHHPTLGGKTEVQSWATRKEATWYAEREVAAANELGFGPVTFRVIPIK